MLNLRRILLTTPLLQQRNLRSALKSGNVIHLMTTLRILSVIGVVWVSLFSWTSHAESLLRVGTYPLHPEKLLLLIGVKTDDSPLDFERLGFQGRDLKQINPLFLLEFNSRQILNVYTFDPQSGLNSPVSSSSNPTELLPLLLSVPDSYSAELKHFTANVSAAIGKSLGFPIAPAVVLSRANSHEPTRKFYAAYLIEILRQCLSFHQFPELISALSGLSRPAQTLLDELGLALLTRYNPYSNWAGLHVPQDGSGTSFARWSAMIMEAQSTHEDTLNAQMAKLVNLGVFRVTDVASHFAYVWINLTRATHLSQEPEYQSLLIPALGKRNIRSMIQKNRDSAPGTESDWVPWCLISFHHPYGPVKILNYFFPGQEAQRMKANRENQFRLDLGGSFIPLSNLILKWIKKTTESTALKSGNTKYLDKTFALGSSLALLETQAYLSFDLSMVNLTPLTESLHTAGIHGFEIASRPSTESLTRATTFLLQEEERLTRLSSAPSREQIFQLKLRFYRALSQTLRLNDPRPNPPRDRSVQRGPAAVSNSLPSSGGAVNEPRPIILFLVDGLRPDRFRIAAQQQLPSGQYLIPELRSLFFEKGTEVESFTPRSLTLPSWSTILTGFESDTHGIRSNSPTSRQAKKTTDNYLNPIKDLLIIKNLFKNRAFRRVEENQTGDLGRIWLPSYYPTEQTLINYVPLVAGATLPTSDLFRRFFNSSSDRLNHAWFPASALDAASSERTAKAIQDDSEGKLRLVINWYAAIDEAQHDNNRYLPFAYQDLDQAIGRVLKAARAHPTLKNAFVVMISDHGHSGGFGPFGAKSAIFSGGPTPKRVDEGPLLLNTGFNLTEFLKGGIPEFNAYQLSVGKPSPMETKPDLSWMTEFSLPNFKFNYTLNWRSPDALVDYIGSNMAQIYLKGQSQWKYRSNYYELTHLPHPKSSTARPLSLNLISDLLQYRLPNPRVIDPALALHLQRTTGEHPVRFIALPLAGDQVGFELDQLGARADTGASTRDPVLVLTQGQAPGQLKTSLILTRSDADGRDWFRYVVLKNFDQSATGRIRAEVSTHPQDDPLQYIGQVPGAEFPFAWRTDHEWLRLARNHPLPTALFSLARSITLSPKFTDPEISPLSHRIRNERIAEIPDLLLVANPGYAFHDGKPLESDHGGLLYEEVRNSFFISSLETQRFATPRLISEPVLTRDYVPTLLDLLFEGSTRLDRSESKLQGDSFRSLFEEG